jgi:soluble lytic murein transglycosylase-like protein
MNSRALLVCLTVLAACAGWATTASAEIVLLTTGKTLSVRAHQLDGDSITLTLRSGGTVTFDRSLVSRILEDEVPYPEPEGAAAVQEQAVRAVPGVIPASTPYADIITAVSKAHGVDPMLVRAVIGVESNYRPRARSPKGAMGLMQLMPATAREYKVHNPYEPRANIEAGIKHLKGLIDKLGVELALAAYNAGEGAVKKFNGIPPYRETRNYVTKILSLAGLQ